MKYAVEARIFNNGRIITKTRPALDGEESNSTEANSCDIWVDIFDTEQEALRFQNEYRRA